MSAPIAGPPPTGPVVSAETDAPPVDNPVENVTPAKRIPADWVDRLTDADFPTLVAVLREHHARRRPLHADAYSILVRLTEGTTR